jgi:hypothetical protein
MKSIVKVKAADPLFESPFFFLKALDSSECVYVIRFYYHLITCVGYNAVSNQPIQN